jgi:hypothetical protein
VWVRAVAGLATDPKRLEPPASGKALPPETRLARAADLLRGGKPRECLAALGPAEGREPEAAECLVRALAHAALKEVGEGRSWLEKGRQWLEEQQSSSLKTRAAWDARLECELLRREAEKALGVR